MTKRLKKPQFGRKAASRILPLAAVTFMLVMLALPLMQPGSALADDEVKTRPRIKITLPTATPTPEVQIQVPVDVDLFPTPAPDESIDPPDGVDIPVGGDEGDGDPTVVLDPDVDIFPTEETEAGHAVIYIEKLACPANLKAYDLDLSKLAEHCTEVQNGVTFSVNDNTSEFYGTTGDAGAGAVEFDVLAKGASIYEQIPAGYDTPRVWCRTSFEGDAPGSGAFTEQNVNDLGGVYHEYAPTELFGCQWYNIPSHGDDPIIKLPGGVEIFDTGDDPIIKLPPCVDGEETTVHFPFGTDLDLGRRRLSVQVDMIDPEWLSSEYRDVVDRDGSVSIDFPADLIVIPVEDGTDIIFPTCDDVEEASTGGTINIVKTECPLGFNAYAADVYDLALNCSAPLANVNFILSDGAQSLGQDATNASGSAGFVDVPAGPVSIVEQIPAGYGEPIVYCITNDPTENQPGDTVGQPVLDGNQVLMIMPEEGEIDCSWFNVPGEINDAGDGSGTISISKTECPIGFDAYSADVYDLAYYCNTPMSGVTFLLSDGAGAIGQSTSDANGSAGFVDVPAIPLTVVEQVPAGYQDPRVFCISNLPGDNAPGDTIEQSVLDGNQIFRTFGEGESLSCTWFNVPSELGNGIEIHKYVCPQAPGLSDSMEQALEDAGCGTLDGIDFALYSGGDLQTTGVSGSFGPGSLRWEAVQVGALSVEETVPAGYETPVVYCSTYTTGGESPLNLYQEDVFNGAVSFEIDENEQIECWWINIPTEDGSITVVKYTCPAGYDVLAQDADPREECKKRTNGVEFSLTIDGGDATWGVSGDYGDKGKTVFGGLLPGHYTIEEIAPAGTESVFVLSCEGLTDDLIQGSPLALGASLSLNVNAGDHIVCRWYNVQESPDFGTIQITKYACVTAYFVTADDCEIYEGGVDFVLSSKLGGDWLPIDEATTNSSGKLVFADLASGTYQIDEVDGNWCYAQADRTDSDGYLIVVAGEVTHVSVWNCGVENEVKEPTTFPNTGVGPVAATTTGAFAPMVVGPGVLSPAAWGSLIFRGLLSTSSGEKPVTVRVQAVGIDANTETLETVNGEMQDPTTSELIAWYKDSARLGTDGNVVLAGHLNYWGDPEGVFFHLADVQVGDEIVVEGDHGGVYIYRVTWIEPVDVDGAELGEIVGKTDSATLTLITCGGEWNPKAHEYEQRTVVRAELVNEAA